MSTPFSRLENPVSPHHYKVAARVGLAVGGKAMPTIFGNDVGAVVQADWLIAKKPLRLSEKFALGAISPVVRTN